MVVNFDGVQQPPSTFEGRFCILLKQQKAQITPVSQKRGARHGHTIQGEKYNLTSVESHGCPPVFETSSCSWGLEPLHAAQLRAFCRVVGVACLRLGPSTRQYGSGWLTIRRLVGLGTSRILTLGQQLAFALTSFLTDISYLHRHFDTRDC